MGRHPKPAELKRLEGNRGHREIREPMPAHGRPPPPPDYMNAPQKERYRAIVRSVAPGLLKAADAPTIERAAVAWDAFRQATIALNKTSGLVRNAKGGVMLNPMSRIQRYAAAMLAEAGAELGLSPISRQRIGDPSRVEDDPFELLMGGAKFDWTDYDEPPGEPN